MKQQSLSETTALAGSPEVETSVGHDHPEHARPKRAQPAKVSASGSRVASPQMVSVTEW